MNKFISIETLYDLFIACDQKITTDTRKLEKGSLFFALKGDNFNANDFALKAIDGGCKYALVDSEDVFNGTNILLVENVLESLQQLAKHHRKQLKCVVIGITGSNGKTTHKELISVVLAKKYNTYATKGNLNNHIGVPLTLLSLTKQHQMAIIEMGANHQGEIALLSDLCDPDYGLITNIGKAHLEGFGGIEGVKIGKSELYKHIRNKGGKVFVNGDDEVLGQLSRGLNIIDYGAKEDFNVYGKLCDNTEFVEFKWNVKSESLENQPIIKTHMFGQYNFINLLCAACIGNYFNVQHTEINAALASYVPEMNRSQLKKTRFNTLILDAYNANPSSVSLAVDNFEKQLLDNKLIILGDMLELGIYSDQEHEKVLVQIDTGTVKNVMLVGPQFMRLKAKFSRYLFFNSVEELNEYLSDHKIANYTVLVKGSRGIKLEKTVEFL